MLLVGEKWGKKVIVAEAAIKIEREAACDNSNIHLYIAVYCCYKM